MWFVNEFIAKGNRIELAKEDILGGIVDLKGGKTGEICIQEKWGNVYLRLPVKALNKLIRSTWIGSLNLQESVIPHQGEFWFDRPFVYRTIYVDKEFLFESNIISRDYLAIRIGIQKGPKYDIGPWVLEDPERAGNFLGKTP